MEYKSVKELAEILSCDQKTVRRIIAEMQRSGRYPREIFLLRIKRTDLDAVIDYCGREKQ